MTAPAPAPSQRRAEWLYALAVLGAHVGFMPLLVLLLPRRVEMLAPGDPITALSWLLLSGAVTASIAFVAAGAWSDAWYARRGDRRFPIVLGTVLLCGAYGVLGTAPTLGWMAVGVIGFQTALNLMFAPLSALLADYVPDARKGRVAGLLSTALPLSYGAVALASRAYPADDDAAFYLVGIAAALLVAPLVIAWPFARGPVSQAPAPASGLPDMRLLAGDFARAWFARFAIQLGAALLLGYQFLYVTGLEDRLGRAPGGGVSIFVGDLSLLALLASFAVALAAGTLSDVLRRRLLPLALLALLTAATLMVLGRVPQWWSLAVAYALFNVGLAGFIAIDTALIAQMLTGHARRGALLGVMNLTNTLPGIVVPALTLLAITQGSIVRVLPVMLHGAAAAAVLAAVLVLRIRSVR